MNLSVIISTYNSVKWLKKVIWGFSVQTMTNFELVVADDGSTIETKKTIDALREETKLQIKHIWHEDKGFQKTIILNRAIIASSANYLVFTDGDCIPRADFLENHVKYHEKGYFLSGGYFKLTMELSNRITKTDIQKNHCFEHLWLKKNGLNSTNKIRKLTASNLKAKILNKLTPTKASWNGHNSSAFKTDLIAINGFDERMQYGGEDRELGERLFNNGIKSKQIRYSAICIHLDHTRRYKTKESIDNNNEIRKYTRSKKMLQTKFGIKKY